MLLVLLYPLVKKQLKINSFRSMLKNAISGQLNPSQTDNTKHI